VFIYTREAHPGERIGHHTSFAQKLEHARLFRKRWSVQRDILVDQLDGPVHRRYGELPNMTYIANPAGRIVYRADWTDAHSIEWVLEYLRHEAGEKQTGRRVAPFFSELLGHRGAMDYPRVFLEGLMNGGVRAVEEYIAAVEQRRGRGQAEPMRRLWTGMQRHAWENSNRPDRSL
jgi:hypothetical protein